MKISNTSILNENYEIQHDMDIWIRDGKIVKIQKHSNSLAEEGVKCCEVLEGRGKLFMPGLIDSHMHTGQQLLRGKVLDAMPMIWTRIMLPFESTLTPKKMRLSAGIAAR